ncbi:hypothetical protein [Mediterraneibacter glycyrrhizinilyticus]|uniref:hypothetical protein n=1 Tax=Mediterraneibacter glycyrrhizinilyticus TaxID=342942 RepID=UPI0025AAE0AA|nr:hypothetical protein [Mediterraneibacter glycyrrhizinilyticus]MDN0044171.1 hypothetical protein [Mediterraneibacter glycyrrhizinilyticus]
MAMPSSYEIYQRAQQSREEITEAITRSLPELSGVDIRRVYFFMYGAGLIKEQSADHESKE